MSRCSPRQGQRRRSTVYGPTCFFGYGTQKGLRKAKKCQDNVWEKKKNKQTRQRTARAQRKSCGLLQGQSEVDASAKKHVKLWKAMVTSICCSGSRKKVAGRFTHVWNIHIILGKKTEYVRNHVIIGFVHCIGSCENLGGLAQKPSKTSQDRANGKSQHRVVFLGYAV